MNRIRFLSKKTIQTWLTNRRGIALRALDQKEIRIIKRGFDTNMTIGLRFQTNLDLFESKNIDTLKEAILKWKHLHKFLSCRITKISDTEYFYDYQVTSISL